MLIQIKFLPKPSWGVGSLKSKSDKLSINKYKYKKNKYKKTYHSWVFSLFTHSQLLFFFLRIWNNFYKPFKKFEIISNSSNLYIFLQTSPYSLIDDYQLSSLISKYCYEPPTRIIHIFFICFFLIFLFTFLEFRF